MKAKNNSWILSLFLPITGFINILLHPNKKNFKIIFIIFFLFIGLGLCIDKNDSSDLSRYVQSFNEASAIESISFNDYLEQYVREENQIDQFTNYTIWLISRITDNYKIYLCFNIFILSLFFSLNVKYIIDRANLNSITKLLIIVLIFTPNIVFCTHRWWIAMQVFTYGLLPIIFEKKYIRGIWCFISFFYIHFSFLYPCILLLIIIILPKRNILPYLIVFLTFSMLDTIDLEFISDIVNMIVPDDIAIRTEHYLYFIELKQNFIARSGLLVSKIVNIFLVCFLYLKTQKEIKQDKVLRNLYVTALIFGTFSAITGMTQWGWRYADLSNIIFMILFIYILSNEIIYNNYKKTIRMLSPLLIYIIIFQIRNLLSIIGPLSILAGNVFTGWFINESVSTLDFIKYYI